MRTIQTCRSRNPESKPGAFLVEALCKGSGALGIGGGMLCYSAVHLIQPIHRRNVTENRDNGLLKMEGDVEVTHHCQERPRV